MTLTPNVGADSSTRAGEGADETGPLSSFDLIVIGSGPAGQKAAIQGLKAGRRVCVIERERDVGGECVHRGTIPSKTLRESALQIARIRGSEDFLDPKLRSGIEVPVLMSRLSRVVKAHVGFQTDQLSRNGAQLMHGHARFVSNDRIEVMALDGRKTYLEGDVVVIATGSRPREPAEVPVDHENILDSDSILSMLYLPVSLVVLGGGVIASEYASIFASLGVSVTMIDRYDKPLGFLDGDLADGFTSALFRAGGRYLGNQSIKRSTWDGVAEVLVTLTDGRVIPAQKMLVALGRIANIGNLGLENTDVVVTERGHIEVDDQLRTTVPHIFAAGDVIGAPALAASSMEQGRRAVCHALSLGLGPPANTIPIGVYTIPELSSVGLTERQAKEADAAYLVGRAPFSELARGQISGHSDGFLKMIADSSGQKLLGVHILGDSATELIHLGQVALQEGLGVDRFIESIFNFPTMAEAYRVAALDILKQRPRA